LFGHTAKILLESFYLLLFFIAIATIKQLPQIKLKWLLDVMVIIASLTSLVVIIKWYNVHPFSNRLHGVFAFSQPIMTAWIYGVPTLICLQRLLSHPNIKIALSYMLLAIPLSAYILLTQSRGPLLGLIIAGLFLILYYRNRRSMLLIVMGLAAFSFYIVSSPSRMLSITNRFDIWQTVFQQGLQAPWFGHGYGTSQTMVINEQGFGHAHNVYLETFYLEGVIGLILLLLLGLAGLKQGLQQFKQPEVVTALAILLFAAICMLTDNQLLVIGPHAVWLNFWAPLFYLLAPNEKVI
jgi:O-antigen ligase